MQTRKITQYNSTNPPSAEQEKKIIDFLYTHLDQYGDPKDDIQECVHYAMARNGKYGGFILEIRDENDKEPIAALVMNKTGMKGYIPENILVYIATNAAYRGKGLGRLLLDKAFEICKGEGVALHCDMDNPARNLYERVGLKVKYYEMRKA